MILTITAMAAALAAWQEAPAKLAGTWQLTVETGHGSGKGDLTIQQDGAKLKGAFAVEEMGTVPMSGEVDGNRVSMSLLLHDGQMKFTITGKVDGDKMSGGTDPEGGSWTAVRK